MEILKNLLQVLLTSIGSIAALFLLTKLIGNKQISQLNMFDYINGITIGSIAAEMATSLESDFLMPLLAMTIYAVSAFTLSLIASRSLKARRFINGRAVILFDSGKLYYDNFKRTKLDLNEFLTQCRVAGYFDLSQIQTAIFEANGSISILPKAEYRPINPTDVSLKMSAEKVPINLILSGEVLEDNLKKCGRDRNWLNDRLRTQGVKNPSGVYLACINASDELEVYLKIVGSADTPQGDIFQ